VASYRPPSKIESGEIILSAKALIYCLFYKPHTLA